MRSAHHSTRTIAAVAVLLGALAAPFVSAAIAQRSARSPVLQSVYRPRLPALSRHALLTAKRARKSGREGERKYLSLTDYNQLRDGAAEMLRRYPPAKHYYLGLGRSPTPVIAFVQNLNPHIASFLPASGLKVRGHAAHPNAQAIAAVADLISGPRRSNERVAAALADLISGPSGPRRPNERAAWRAHLQQFLPDDLLRDLEASGRGILLIDRATTGNSLVVAKKHLEKYIADQGRSVPVNLLAFSGREVPMERIDLHDRGELRYINKYEPWAPWDQFRIGIDNPSALRERPAYTEFRSALLTRMQRDATIEVITREANNAIR